MVQAAQAANTARGVQEIGQRILQPAPSLTFGGRGGGRGGGGLTPELTGDAAARRDGLQRAVRRVPRRRTAWARRSRGGAGATMAPPLVSSTRVQGHRDYVIKTILHGMTGPIDGKKYADVMVPMGTNTDEWIAAVASYVRSGFGGAGWLVTPADVARVRAATAGRKTPWTLEELEASLPRALVADATWKVTASHNAADAAQGVNFLGLDDRRAAAARHVVPGRAAGAADADGDSVQLPDAGRRQRKPARRGDVPARLRRAGVHRRHRRGARRSRKAREAAARR